MDRLCGAGGGGGGGLPIKSDGGRGQNVKGAKFFQKLYPMVR